MFGIAWVELPEKIRAPILLTNIAGRNDTVVYIILAFILVLVFSSSIQKLDSFKPSLKQAVLTGILFYAALVSLAITPYTEFIYFNF